jgi:hypothetical protein
MKANGRVNTISEESKHVLSAIAAGKLLRIARDGSGCRLIDPPAREQSFGQIPIPGRVAQELLLSGLLAKLSVERVNQRLGLRELGVRDWNEADYWCCAQ